jgi:hypothetical protein
MLLWEFKYPLLIIVRKSHETYPHLPPPTSSSFPLDFSQLLQATVANPSSKRNTKLGRTGSGKHSIEEKASNLLLGERIEEIFNEDEGDWDLVDDDV